MLAQGGKNISILLEAAKYLDYRAEALARGEVPQDYSTFTNGELSPNIEPNLSQPASPSTSFVEDGRERRVGFSRQVRSEDDSGTSIPDTESGDSGLRLGTREVHNRLEKNRRAHLKECFETLKKQLPNLDEKKTSNLSILRSALRYIQILKRKERDYEQEMERLAQEKITQQQRLAALKRDLCLPMDGVDLKALNPEQEMDVDTNSTSTASETGPMSDIEDESMEPLPIKPCVPANATAGASTLPTCVPPKSQKAVPVQPQKLALVPSSQTAVATVTVGVPSTSTAVGPNRQTVVPKAVAVVPVPEVKLAHAVTTVKTQQLQQMQQSAGTSSAAPHQLQQQVQQQSVVLPPAMSQHVAPSTLQMATAAQAAPALQAIVSKGSGAIMVNSLVNTLTPQATHLQIPAQMVSHTGIHVNGGANIISHPATVQVISQQGVRVLSGTQNVTLATAHLPMMNQSACSGQPVSSVSAPTFVTTVNVVAPRMAPLATMTASTTTAKTISNAILPTTMTLSKTNLVPVGTVMAAPQQSLGKGLMTASANTIPVTMAQLAVKASPMQSLTIPTTLTMSRPMTLQTSTVTTQGMVSLTGVTNVVPTATIQMSNAVMAGVKAGTTTHILQPQISPSRAVLQHTAAVHAQGTPGVVQMSAHLNHNVRQMVTTTMKPAQLTAQVRTPITQIAHVVQQQQHPPPSVTVSSTPGQLIGQMTVMNHLTQAQLGKTAAPTLLKPVSHQIPLVQAQQFLSTTQSIVKPVVVVSTPANVMSAAAPVVIGGGQTVPHKT